MEFGRGTKKKEKPFRAFELAAQTKSRGNNSEGKVVDLAPN